MKEYRVNYQEQQKVWGVIEKPFRGPCWHGTTTVPNHPSCQRLVGHSNWSIDIDDVYPGDAVLQATDLFEKGGIDFSTFSTEAYRIIYEGERHYGKSVSNIIWWAYPINPRAIEMITEPTVCWWNGGDTFLQIDVRDSYPYLALNYAHNAIEDYLWRNK